MNSWFIEAFAGESPGSFGQVTSVVTVPDFLPRHGSPSSDSGRHKSGRGYDESNEALDRSGMV